VMLQLVYHVLSMLFIYALSNLFMCDNVTELCMEMRLFKCFTFQKYICMELCIELIWMSCQIYLNALHFRNISVYVCVWK
jgi:hypothetical protein